jgi:hypothetical protein
VYTPGDIVAWLQSATSTWELPGFIVVAVMLQGVPFTITPFSCTVTAAFPTFLTEMYAVFVDVEFTRAGCPIISSVPALPAVGANHQNQAISTSPDAIIPIVTIIAKTGALRSPRIFLTAPTVIVYVIQVLKNICSRSHLLALYIGLISVFIFISMWSLVLGVLSDLRLFSIVCI